MELQLSIEYYTTVIIDHIRPEAGGAKTMLTRRYRNVYGPFHSVCEPSRIFFRPPPREETVVIIITIYIIAIIIISARITPLSTVAVGLCNILLYTDQNITIILIIIIILYYSYRYVRPPDNRGGDGI